MDVKIENNNTTTTTTDSKEEYFIIAIDRTGIKVTNRGQWMNKKWNTRRKKGYLKFHVAVDIQSKKILSIEITDDEHVHDSDVTLSG